MRNKVTQAFDFLEGREAGSFSATVKFCLEHGGVVHAAPDCFLAGVPCADDAGCLYVVFQCSHLPALRRVLLSLGWCERVRWGRGMAGRGDGYGTRERAVADFCRHEDFGTGLTKDH